MTNKTEELLLLLKISVKVMQPKAGALIQEAHDQIWKYRESLAETIQQMPEIGMIPFAWEKLDDESKNKWRQRAEEAMLRMSPNEKS